MSKLTQNASSYSIPSWYTYYRTHPPKYTSMVISDDLEDVLEVLEAKSV